MVKSQDPQQIAVSVAAVANKQFDYGATFKIEWIAKRAGIKMPTECQSGAEAALAQPELGRFLGHFYKEMLERHKKQVKCVHDWTVMILHPQDQASHNSELWEKRLSFANRRARAGLTHTRIDRLDVDQKRERSEAIARVGALETFMERGYVLTQQQKQSPRARAKKAIERASERTARQQEASQDFFIQD